MAAILKILVPQAEHLICNQFGINECLTPYYRLFDLLLLIVPPMMFCFAASMVILMEIDDHIALYYSMTPLGKRGYLVSRLLIPAFLVAIYSFALYPFFMLSSFELGTAALYIMLTCLLGGITSLLIVALSSNKVEGMAIAKLSGLSVLGLLATYFITNRLQYMLCILPSFWLAKFAIDSNYLYVFTGMSCALIWIYLLQRRFVRKMS